METHEIFILVMVLLAAASLRRWIASRRNAKTRRAAVEIVAECPSCGTHVGLERYRNAICPNCSGSIAFFETFEEKEFRRDLTRSPCPECGELNFDLIALCTSCGAGLRPGHPDAES